MAHKPHWNPVPNKSDLAQDVDDLLAQLSGDPVEHLKHPERIAKTDLMCLERVLGDLKRRLENRGRP